MKQVRIAVVGCGYVAQAEHIPCILSSRHARLAALVEPRAGVREALAKRLDVPAFATLGELLAANVIIDAVDLCAGPLTHPRIATDCMAAGLPILVEKPLCHSVSQGIALAEEVERRNACLMVGYMRRYDDDVLEIKRLIEAGAIGRVHALHSVFKLALRPHFQRLIDPPSADVAVLTFNDPDPSDLLPDDQILNQSLHQINLTRFLGGEVRAISGVQKAPRAIHVLMDLHDGVVATHAHVNGMGHGEEIWIYGEAGSIHSRLWSPHIPFQFPETRLFDRAGREERLLHIPRLNPYQNEIEAFCDAVLDGTPHRSPATDAVRDLQVIEAIHAMSDRAEMQAVADAPK